MTLAEIQPLFAMLVAVWLIATPLFGINFDGGIRWSLGLGKICWGCCLCGDCPETCDNCPDTIYWTMGDGHAPDGYPWYYEQGCLKLVSYTGMYPQDQIPLNDCYGSSMECSYRTPYVYTAWQGGTYLQNCFAQIFCCGASTWQLWIVDGSNPGNVYPCCQDYYLEGDCDCTTWECPPRYQSGWPNWTEPDPHRCEPYYPVVFGAGSFRLWSTPSPGTDCGDDSDYYPP